MLLRQCHKDVEYLLHVLRTENHEGQDNINQNIVATEVQLDNVDNKNAFVAGNEKYRDLTIYLVIQLMMMM